MYKVVLDLNKIDNQNNSISFKVLDYVNSDLLPKGEYLEGVLFIDANNKSAIKRIHPFSKSSANLIKKKSIKYTD